MTKLTLEEKRQLKRAIKTALKGFHFWELLFWDLFKRKKSKVFAQCIKNGMHWEAAYRTAKAIQK